MSSNYSCSLLILFSLLFLLNLEESSSCVRQCGGIDIPFPFGIGKGCYLEKWYEIECVSSSIHGRPEPFLSVIQKQVVSITLPSNGLRHYEADQLYDVGKYGSIYIKDHVTSKGCTNHEDKTRSADLNLTGTPFYVSYSNILVAYGCNNTASLTNVKPNIVGCTSSCGILKDNTTLKGFLERINCIDRNTEQDQDFSSWNSKCGEEEMEKGCNVKNGCCIANMPNKLQQVIGVNIEDNNTTECKIAFLTTDSIYSLDPQLLHDVQYSTIKLGWFIQTTNISFINSLRGCQDITGGYDMYYDDPKKICVCEYRDDLGYAKCACKKGYGGSPYHGCKDIDECKLEHNLCSGGRICVNSLGSYHCVYPKIRIIVIGIGAAFGSLVFICGLYWFYKFIIKQKRLYQRKKFFKRNGGLLLQQQLISTHGNIEKTRLFGSQELEKATESFSVNRILGQGGQGTVYKGMLVDGRIVAIKKSKVVDEDKLEEFINEVVILSQINHRNIVKLLGCCLETNVPILVYEFIPNGNLFEHLHDKLDDDTIVTWEVRLRMAIDVAGALSYLHSAASSPIYHRDVKSTNIMLDEKFRAKVSDFGTSRSVTVDHTHLTTVVSGTMGYMDPEYFQSSQFSDKSDVYSFGVVLAELITGEKSISFLRSQKNRGLATYFTVAMKENKLFDIIDARIKDECKLNQVTSTAKIARRCLNLKGKKRPTMREVSMQLEKIRSSLEDMQPHDYVSENEEEKEEEVMELNIGLESWNNNVVITAPASEFYVAASSSLYSDGKPLFPLQTR